MKNMLKTMWSRFVNYMNSAPVGSRGQAALGSYAGLCDLGHGEDGRH